MREVFFRHQQRSPPINHHLSVVCLMIVGRMGEGHEHGGLSGYGQFRHGRRPGPAQHQIGPLIRRGHILDERRHARSVDAVRPVSGKHALQIEGARLMPDFDPGLHQAFQAGEDRGIDGLRPLAAAHDQKAAGAGMPNSVFPGLHNSLAHGIACKLALSCVKSPGHVRQGQEHPFRQLRQHAVGQARHGILLVHGDGDAGKPARHQRREGA